MTREYQDEKILRIRQAMEVERALEATENAVAQEIANQDITSGQATVYGKIVKFASREFLDGKIRITMPEEWEDMPHDFAKLKYPYESRPPIILMDSTSALNFTVNHTMYPLKPEELSAFVNTISFNC